jgi:hypothetical protein
MAHDGTGRAAAVDAALLRLAPRVPKFERGEIVAHALASPGLRHAAPEAAAWLSAVAHIRHLHTDYDDLLDDGWGVEAARHATLEALNAVLAEWGAKRRVSGADEAG